MQAPRSPNPLDSAEIRRPPLRLKLTTYELIAMPSAETRCLDDCDVARWRRSTSNAIELTAQ